MADVTIGAKLTLDAGQSVKTMKEFKQEVKSAEAELLNMQATFGATSKEALTAAKRVAELKDNLQDANETAKLFDPGNKFQVLGNAVRGLVGGFTALQGALALAGVEGEDLQKTLLKVQGALALTEGLNVIADVTKDFQRLGAVLVQTLGKSGLIGIAIAGVGLLTAAFLGAFDGVKKLTLAQSQLLDVQKEATAAAVKERVELDLLYKVANNTALSTEKRLEAVKVLQKEFPGYFKNINTEKDLNNNLTAAYNSATEGILNKAKATATFNKIVENENEILKENNKLQELQEKREKTVGIFRFAANEEIKRTINNIKELTAANVALANSVPASDITSSFGGGSTTTSTPAVTRAKEENKAIELEYSKSTDNLLLLQAEREQAFIDNKYLFVEEGKRLEQEEFDAKIALLNAELDSEENATRQKIALAQLERDARVQAAYDIGAALGALSELIGKQTAAGKVLAIAQAVINTWLGVTEVLKTKSVLPEPLATISKIANITTVIATGLNAVKNIGKAKVPGGGGGGASVGALATPAPLQPRSPQATNTLLNQQQLNQLGNAAVRAFVVESDVTGNQERIRRLNRAARI